MTRILIADDANENRYMLIALLKGNGYEVESAANGAEALEMAHNSPPDLIVTDIMMPEMDGFELCRQWRKDENLKRIPFVIYTATYTDPKDERLGLKLGADRFLVKPQKPELILSVIREVLQETTNAPDSVRSGSSNDEVVLLQQHRETLMRKLEKKVLDLESEIARRTAIEAELRESERRFRLLAENASDVVWSMGFDGRLTYVSPSFEKRRGYTPEEAMERPVEEAVPAEALKLFQERLSSVLADLDAGREPDLDGLFEVEETRKDGTTAWSEVSVSLMRDETGKAIGFQGVSRDITERKRADILCEFRLRLLEFAMGHSLDEVLQWTLDEVEDLTRSAVSFYHFVSPDQRTLLLRAWSDKTAQDSFRAENQGQSHALEDAGPWADCVRQGRPVIRNSLTELSRGDDSPKGHACLERVLAVPIVRGERIVAVLGIGNRATDYGEEDIRMVSFLADVAWEVAQRKLAEEEVREAEKRLEAIFNASVHGILVVDVETKQLVQANPAICTMLGYTKEELTKLGVEDIHPQESLDHAMAAFASRARRESTVSPSIPCLRKDGTTFCADIAGSPIIVDGRECHVGFFLDVTDRIKSEEERQHLQSQLLQAQKIESIGRLAGGVAHDFNNLLSVVLCYTGFAIDAVREGDPLRSDLSEIHKAGERAAALTRQLLAFSRKQILEPEVLNLSSAVSGIESMLRRLLEEDIEIDVHLADDLGSVMADPGQVEQVIMNLAVNARDAMPQGGRLIIETANVDLDEGYAEMHVAAKPGRYVMLSVTDTGIGMDSETKEHLFEPFFTTKETVSYTHLTLPTN